MKLKEKKLLWNHYKTVIITGGSSGIGLAYLHSILNLNHIPLVFNISRTKPQIICNSSCDFKHLSCDLSSSSEIKSTLAVLVDAITYPNSPKGPILLINNSGFGSYGDFEHLGIEHELTMIDVNVKAVLELTHGLLPLMKEQGGAIMNIASVAGFMPTPYLATYGASKAFLLHWTLALRQELYNSNVRVLAVCPGPTKTNFFKAAGLKQPVLPNNSGQSPQSVVQESWKALARGKPYVVCRFRNKLLVALTSSLPKGLAAFIGRIILGRIRRKAF